MRHYDKCMCVYDECMMMTRYVKVMIPLCDIYVYMYVSSPEGPSTNVIKSIEPMRAEYECRKAYRAQEGRVRIPMILSSREGRVRRWSSLDGRVRMWSSLYSRVRIWSSPGGPSTHPIEPIWLSTYGIEPRWPSTWLRCIMTVLDYDYVWYAWAGTVLRWRLCVCTCICICIWYMYMYMGNMGKGRGAIDAWPPDQLV